MAESEEELKSLLVKIKEKSETAGLKLNIQKTKIMASSPIISWQIDWKKWKQWHVLFYCAPKIARDGICNHKIKRCLLLERKCITNLYRVLKSKDISLPTKVHLVKTMVFSIVMWVWELDHKEGWVPKNWCFWITVLEKTWESLGLQGDQTCQS